jgi:hypothetical protein
MRRVLLFLVVVPAAFAGQYDLLVGHSDPGKTSDVETNIGGDPFYDSVTYENWYRYTPSVAHLLNYGCVYTWTNLPPANPSGLGDNLADYVDGGGTVVLCSATFATTYGIGGRIMTDENYSPIIHNCGWDVTLQSLGNYDNTHEFMHGVSSIGGIQLWLFADLETPATWVADLENGYTLAAVNADYNCAGVNLFPSDSHRWYGDGWVLFNNTIQCLMYRGDAEPPYVDWIDPGDGDSDVPLDSDIVFRCRDDESGIDVDTIDFKAEDTSLSDGRVVSAGASLSVTYGSNRSIAGDLDVNDADLHSVVCVFTPTDPLPEGDVITCTVYGILADRKGNEMGEDFVWTFSTGNYGVEQTSWGAIKAGF